MTTPLSQSLANYGRPEDLATIDAYMRQAAVAAVADAIRARAAELEVVDLERSAIRVCDDPRLPEFSSLSASESSRERVQHVTVRPVVDVPRAAKSGWLVRNWPRVAIVLVVLVTLGVGAWLLVLALAAAFAALATALAAAVPVLLGIGALVLLITLCGGRGSGGGGFSGTFQGRMH